MNFIYCIKFATTGLPVGTIAPLKLNQKESILKGWIPCEGQRRRDLKKYAALYKIMKERLMSNLPDLRAAIKEDAKEDTIKSIRDFYRN